MKEKTNVIVIMTDQQRADIRLSEGFALNTTPHIDEMALSGADFTKAYTTMPVCVAARVSLFTGRYPNATRVKTNHNAQDAYYEQDLLDIFKAQGYRTALCGKNHSHKNLEDFDYAYELTHLVGYRHDMNANEMEQAFDQHIKDLGFATEMTPSKFPLECQGPYRAVSKAINWIEEEDSPFFLWLSFAEPHNPYQVPEPYFSMFENQIPPLESSKEDLNKKGFKYRWLREMWEQTYHGFDKVIERTRANYYGMLRMIDDQIKRFLDVLDAKGLSENTIIVFLSDHGDFVGEYGLIRKGPELPEVLCRIPLIFNGPNIKPIGKISDYHVSIADVLPTLCDAIGADIPAGVQGRSLWQLLTTGKTDKDVFSSAYMEHGFGGDYYDYDDNLDPKEEGAISDFSPFDELNSWTQCGTMRAIRKDRYKLIYDMKGEGQLYDLEIDPLELNNLFDIPEYNEIKTSMMEELMKKMIQEQDPLPYPRRRYIFKEFSWGEHNE